MNDNEECPLCHQEEKGISQPGGICDSCADLLEFGYHAFPAYTLQEDLTRRQQHASK